jgi:hypothetical protein
MQGKERSTESLGRPADILVVLEGGGGDWSQFSRRDHELGASFSTILHGVGGEEAADGQGPLHLAAQWGQEEVVTALIEHGADMNRQDAEGRTPLHHAIQNGQQGIINMLLGCPGIHLSARYNNLEDLFLVQFFCNVLTNFLVHFLTTIIWIIGDIAYTNFETYATPEGSHLNFFPLCCPFSPPPPPSVM